MSIYSYHNYQYKWPYKAQDLEDFDKEAKQRASPSSMAISEAHSAAVEVLCRSQDRAILGYLSELKESGKEVSLL